MKRWFTPQEVAEKQLACPLSVGQAEAGRYTYCIADKCMAWDWGFKPEDKTTMLESDELPEGWKINSEPVDGTVEIVRIPTHGRCAMVP